MPYLLKHYLSDKLCPLGACGGTKCLQGILTKNTWQVQFASAPNSIPPSPTHLQDPNSSSLQKTGFQDNFLNSLHLDVRAHLHKEAREVWSKQGQMVPRDTITGHRSVCCFSRWSWGYFKADLRLQGGRNRVCSEPQRIHFPHWFSNNWAV